MKLSEFDSIAEMIDILFSETAVGSSEQKALYDDVVHSHSWFESREHGIVLIRDVALQPGNTLSIPDIFLNVYSEDGHSDFEWDVARFLYTHRNSLGHWIGAEFNMDYVATALRRISKENGLWHV